MNLTNVMTIISLMIIVLALSSFTEYAYAEVHYVRVNDVGKNCPANNSCFLPSIANVTIGDTVVWIGDGKDHHIFNTTAGERIDMDLSLNNLTFSHIFNSAGVFPYIDSFYPGVVEK